MTASYLQNNDYTPLQLRKPYQLPVNDIAQTVATLDSYWKQGAARVKAQYENVAGLNLTLDPLKSYTQDFLKQAQDQLKKLSTKDLSSRDVQMEGMNLFKPILSGDNEMSQKILQDHAITNMRNSIISEAQMYKTKDGGKLYADENLIDALSAFKDFKGDTDPNQLGVIYEKAKNARYVPYYDVQAELIKIRDKCGEVSGTQLGGMRTNQGVYDVTISGTPSEKLRGCLEYLSPQANTQIGITGRVRYGNNYQALGNDILLMNNSLEKDYTNKISRLSGAISSKKLDDRNLSNEEILALTENKTLLETRLRNIREQNTKISANDFSEIVNNYDEYAGQVYKNKVIDGFANTFYTQEVEPEVNYFQKMATEQQYALERIKYTQDLKDASEKKKDEENNTPTPMLSGDQGKEQSGKTYDQLQKELEPLNQEMIESMKSFFADLKSNIGNDSSDKILNNTLKWLKVAGGENQIIDSEEEVKKAYNYIDHYYKQALSDNNQRALSLLKGPYNQMSTLSERMSSNRKLMEMADNEVEKTIKPQSFKLNNGVVLSEKEFQKIQNGTHSEYYITPYKDESIFGSSLLKAREGIDVNKNTITGKGFLIKRRDNNETVMTPIQYDKQLFELDEKIKNTRNDYLTKLTANQYLRFDINDKLLGTNLKKQIVVAGGLSNTLKPEKLNESINIFPTFMDGTVDFQFVGLKPEELEKVKENMKTSAGNVFGGTWTEIDAEKGLYRITNLIGDYDKLSRFGNVESMKQLMNLAKEEISLRNRMGNKGSIVEIKYNPDSKKLYIKEDTPTGTVVIKDYPASNLIDALMMFNSLTN